MPRLQAAIVRHLPLLIYGGGAADDRGRGATAGQHEGEGSLITSVYFDNPSLNVYHSRLTKEDGAAVARVR